MKMKRILPIILVLALICGLITAIAATEKDYRKGSITLQAEEALLLPDGSTWLFDAGTLSVYKDSVSLNTPLDEKNPPLAVFLFALNEDGTRTVTCLLAKDYPFEQALENETAASLSDFAKLLPAESAFSVSLDVSGLGNLSVRQTGESTLSYTCTPNAGWAFGALTLSENTLTQSAGTLENLSGDYSMSVTFRHTAHSFEQRYNETEHYDFCPVCGLKQHVTEHTLAFVPDTDENSQDMGTHHVACAECEYAETSLAHIFEYVQDGADTHHQHCTDCGYNTPAEAHVLSYAADADGHHQVCSLCDFESAHTAHDWAATLLYDADGHRQKCTTCAYESAPTAHTLEDKFDTANHWQECADCDYETVHTAHTLEDKFDTAGHWQECADCDYETVHTAHTLEDKFDTTAHWQACANCDYETTHTAHTMEDKFDTANHWQECADCDYETTHVAHSAPKRAYSNTEHWDECPDCGYHLSQNTSHTLAYDASDSDAHWQYCTQCDYVSAEKKEHTIQIAKLDEAYCHLFCSVCGFEPLKIGHIFNEDPPEYDTAGHWMKCISCNGHINYTAHSLVYNSDENGHWMHCTACAYTSADKAAHTFTWQKVDETYCAQVCTTCGYKGQTVTHMCVSTTYDATGHWSECSYCHGKIGFEAHELTLKYYSETTHARGCKTCLYCDESTLAAHNYNIPCYNDLAHWTECACGNNINQARHTLVTKSDTVNHWWECESCAYESAHISHILEDQYDNDAHWQECADCDYETDHVGHSYAYITTAQDHRKYCTQCQYLNIMIFAHNFTYQKVDEFYCQQVCTICGYKGQTVSHSYQLASDATGHWTECVYCHDKSDFAAHEMTLISLDEYTHGKACRTCNYLDESSKEAHNCNIPLYDETIHWNGCACGSLLVTTGDGYHTLEYKSNATSHWQECTGCAYKTTPVAHTLVDKFDTDNHWQECANCDYETEHTPHTLAYNTEDPDAHWLHCTDCGYASTAVEAHQFVYQRVDDLYCQEVCTVCGRKNDEERHISLENLAETTGHWVVCGNCQSKLRFEAHEMKLKYFPDTHVQACASCSYVDESTRAAHNIVTKYDDVNHYKGCSVCDFVEPNTTEAHEIWKMPTLLQSDVIHTVMCIGGCGYQVTENHSISKYEPYGSGFCRAECECGYCYTAQAHDMQYISLNDTRHANICMRCNTNTSGMDYPHAFAYRITTDGMCEQYCTWCNYSSISGHQCEWKDNGDGTHSFKCVRCGNAMEGSAYTNVAHSMTKYVDNNDGTHSPVCVDCGSVASTESHTINEVKNDDGHGSGCTLCSYTALAFSPHSWAGWTAINSGIMSTQHKRTCAVCLYEQKGDHRYDDADRCELCGYIKGY